MVLSDIRNYEVSIWTLQDGFISVLKYATLENKGQIQEPELKIVDDGTQEFTFKIPMYIIQDGQMIQNPIWYNTTNGVLMASTRKIKVIVNKKDAVRNVSQQRATQDERVFQFIVTKVVQTHQDNILTCEVTCQGLAFHELGKIGYKFSLSQQEFLNEYSEWANATDEQRQQKKLEEPHATIQYWNDKIFNRLKYWTYQINMNWDGYLFKNENGTIAPRESFRVYQDTYVSSWDKNTGKPKKIEMAKEKQRLINSSESNVYNLTQTIAENFGVHCKYVYQHDNNYNIIGKKVIYYNNFLNQTYGALDLTYPYNTSSISREMDSTNLVTKMYVKPVTSETSRDGFINILTTSANRSGEDYLLNFDYMRDIGSITQEQYQEIPKFERKVAKINDELQSLQEEIIKLQQAKVGVQADLSTYDRGKKLAEQRYTEASELVNSLTNNTGVLHVTGQRPANAVLLQDNNTNSYYLNITQTGIIPETLHIYRKYSYTAIQKDRVSDQIFGTFQFNEFNDIVKVVDIFLNDSLSFSRSVYLTYDYQPLEYAKRVQEIWARKRASDQAQYRKASVKIEKINSSLEIKNNKYQQLVSEKRSMVQSFQTMMGPALRQGYWLPDQYKDYGDKIEAIFSQGFCIGTIMIDENSRLPLQDSYGNYCFQYDQNYKDDNECAIPIWDTIPFENQQLPYYEQGINRDKKFYECIKLTSQQLQYIQNNQNVSFIFYDLTMNQTLKNYRSFALGSQCQLGLLKQNGKVFPILILIGSKDMTEEQIKNMKSSGNNDFIYSKTVSNQKNIVYAPNESTVELDSRVSRKLVQQSIITMNAQDEKIQQKTITKQYSIEKIQDNEQNQTDVPQPQEEKAIGITQPFKTKAKDFPRVLSSSNMTILAYFDFSKAISSAMADEISEIFSQVKSDLSINILVSTKNHPRAVAKIEVLINGVAEKIFNCKLRQGTNIFHFQNLDITGYTDKSIGIKISSYSNEYWLPIEQIEALLMPRQENNVSAQYEIKNNVKIDIPPKETLEKVIIQEKNLFHPQPFKVSFQGEDLNQIYLNEEFYGTGVGTLSLSFYYIENNKTYFGGETYNIDYVNKDIYLRQRTISYGGETLYLETRNATGESTIEDNLSTNITKTLNKTISASRTEKDQQGRDVAIKVFNVIVDKLQRLSSINTCACLGKIQYTTSGQTINVNVVRGVDISPQWERSLSINRNIHEVASTYTKISSNNWITLSNSNYGYEENNNVVIEKEYISVFPRIQINSLKLKEDSLQLSLLYNEKSLTKYTDYILSARNNKYYLSIKLQQFLQINKNTSNNLINKISLDDGTLKVPQLKLYYCLSNADTAIYLDAIQVLKENAFPKVSYQIDVNMVNPDFIRTIYNKMGYITHINDNQLKFENVLGYISEITMHLDKPWEDQIVIKNYKTDFENLFSTIVASTQAMKKNAYTIGLAAGAFDVNGNLSLQSIAEALAERGIVYNFNNGRLTINQKDGILGISQSGVVNFRCDGIFTSSKKDENGMWIWNTAITPNGINADLITTGQLDTNRIKIYSGDNLRFQFNENGLFGYKSLFEDFKGSHALQKLQHLRALWTSFSPNKRAEYNNNFDNYFNSLNNSDGYTNLQYIKFNENGLFLVAEADATVYANNKYTILEKDVTRIQLSWTGLKLRNWNNQQVFWADPDSGNLYITGTVFADSFKILKHKADLNDENAVPIGLLDFLSINFEDHVRTSQNLQYIFNAAGDILKRSLSSLSTLNGDIVENAGILNGFLSRAKQIPHSPIELITGDGQDAVSAISIHPSQGIWMGSTNSITFYAGDTRRLERNNKTGQYIDMLKGASVLIDKDKILFGVATIKGVPEDIPPEEEEEGDGGTQSGENDGNNENTQPDDSGTSEENNQGEVTPEIVQTSAIEITAQQIVLSVGQTIGSFQFKEDEQTQFITTQYTPKINYNILKSTQLQDPQTGEIVPNDISGVVISKDSIGLATTTITIDNTIQRDLILMDQNGIIIGVAEDANAHIDDTPIDNSSINNSGNNDNTSIGVKSGSFVKISKLGIIIGSDANLYINTKNALLQTSKTLISHNKPVTIFGLGYNISDWNNLDYYDMNTNVSSPIRTTTDSSGNIVETFSSITTTHINRNGDSSWGLFFDGENLHIKGFLYAKNVRIMLDSGDGGHGYTFPDYLHYQYQTRTKVSNTLKDIFSQVGRIIKFTSVSLTDFDQLVIENGPILDGFIDSIQYLRPLVYTEGIQPTYFKPGDIWIPESGDYSGNQYIAMSYYNSNTSGVLNGWNRTYNGSLASITGAKIDIDTVDGTIDIKAESTITIGAKNLLDLSGGDIQITGNNSINIGSKWINIGSINGGINIVSTNIDKYTETDEITGEIDVNGNINLVQIDRNGISMRGSSIELIAGANSDVSVLSLDPSRGIWLGSTNTITFFSQNYLSDQATGAVEISSERILFGVSTSSSATAVEMTNQYLIFAAGNRINNLRDTDAIDWTQSVETGVKITKNGLWIATGSISSSEDPRAMVSITPGNILIGTSTNDSGSFVEIDQDGITIGSSSYLIINTNNIAIDTFGHSENDNSYNTYFRLGSVNNPGLLFDGTNLFIRGSVYANAFYVIGEDNIPVLFDDYLQASIGDIDISSTLVNIFNEAGNVLQAATTSISELRSYVAENDSIYESLKTKLMNGLVSDQRKIELFGSNGIQLYTGALDISNETINNLSVIKIDQTNGIWLGSSVGITLYATPGTNDTTYSNANVSITNSQILFGVSSTGDATVAQFKKDYIILCAADQRQDIESASTTAEWQSASQTGVKITKDGFWIASGSSSLNNRALVAITPGNITLGTVDSNYEGSFVEIAQTGITIGSTSNLYINTNNFGLNTDADNQHNSYFRLGPSDGASLVYSNGQLVVAGQIRASSLYIGNSSTAITDTSQLGGGSGYEFYQTSSTVPSTYKKNDLWLQTGTGKLFVAIQDKGSSAVVQDWQVINEVVHGGSFEVNTRDGTITAYANKSIMLCQSDGTGGPGNNDTITNILSLSSNGIKIYSTNSIQIGVETQTTNQGGTYTTNAITLSNQGIDLKSGSLTLSASTTISMASAGTFRITAKQGYLEFYDSTNKITVFRVDNDGNVYCKSLTTGTFINGTTQVVTDAQINSDNSINEAQQNTSLTAVFSNSYVIIVDTPTDGYTLSGQQRSNFESDTDYIVSVHFFKATSSFVGTTNNTRLVFFDNNNQEMYTLYIPLIINSANVQMTKEFTLPKNIINSKFVNRTISKILVKGHTQYTNKTIQMKNFVCKIYEA